MNQKRILLLVGALALLVLLTWLSGYFGGAPSTVETPEISLHASDIHRITVQKADESIVAVLSENGEWRLRDPVDAPVDTAASSRLLRSIGDLRVESLVTSQPGRYARYQVDSSQATLIRLDGEQSVEMYVGKSGPDFQSKYVRFGGDDRVFLATGVPTADPSLDQWRNKILWSYPVPSVTAVSVSAPGTAYRLTSGEGGRWIMEQSGTATAADSAGVARYLGRLAEVKADGFLISEPAALVTDSTTHRVEVSFLDGTTHWMAIRQRDSDAVALSPSALGEDEVLKLFSYRVQNLAPPASDLLPD